MLSSLGQLQLQPENSDSCRVLAVNIICCMVTRLVHFFLKLVYTYMLARDIAINSHSVELDKDLLAIILNRIIHDLGEIVQIRNLVMSNIDNNKKILAQLEKSSLLMEFNQKYLTAYKPMAVGTTACNRSPAAASSCINSCRVRSRPPEVRTSMFRSMNFAKSVPGPLSSAIDI